MYSSGGGHLCGKGRPPVSRPEPIYMPPPPYRSRNRGGGGGHYCACALFSGLYANNDNNEKNKIKNKKNKKIM